MHLTKKSFKRLQYTNKQKKQNNILISLTISEKKCKTCTYSTEVTKNTKKLQVVKKVKRKHQNVMQGWNQLMFNSNVNQARADLLRQQMDELRSALGHVTASVVRYSREFFPSCRHIKKNSIDCRF